MDHHKQSDRLQVFINTCLRRILNIHWPDGIAYKELQEKTAQAPVLYQIWRRKWNWLGHMLRRNDDSITKQVLQWTAQDHRGRGRAKNTWRRGLEKVMWTDSRIQVQLEEDGGGRTRQSWMETSGRWPMFHWERQGVSQVITSDRESTDFSAKL